VAAVAKLNDIAVTGAARLGQRQLEARALGRLMRGQAL
jgi:hypothetical protein